MPKIEKLKEIHQRANTQLLSSCFPQAQVDHFQDVQAPAMEEMNRLWPLVIAELEAARKFKSFDPVLARSKKDKADQEWFEARKALEDA